MKNVSDLPEDLFHEGEPTGEHDRREYNTCACACACDRDPGRARLCADCRHGDHVPCYADCPAPPPHFGPVSLPQGSGR
jgi:hypothetical protein